MKKILTTTAITLTLALAGCGGSATSNGSSSATATSQTTTTQVQTPKPPSNDALRAALVDQAVNHPKPGQKAVTVAQANCLIDAAIANGYTLQDLPASRHHNTPVRNAKLFSAALACLAQK